MGNNKSVIIVGGGIAGLKVAEILSKLNINTIIIEKGSEVGGNLLKWDRIFPDGKYAVEVINALKNDLGNTNIITNSEVFSINKDNNSFIVLSSNSRTHKADAVVLTTGFEIFDATRKEEYGYGIYDNVITSVDLENIFKNKGNLFRKDGKIPQKIAFIHCVGSRDIKVNNLHCSSVCCITAVKQAIELKELYPELDIYCFYMDLRMYGRHFEEIYYEAQEKYNINFIRGRLSEASETIDGKLLLKAEDTLIGKPLRLTVDTVVLMVGISPDKKVKNITQELNIKWSDDGFINVEDEHIRQNHTNINGIFVAGTITGPKSIQMTINDAANAAASIYKYLTNTNE